MEKFEQLTDEQKQELKNCFEDGDANVFEQIGSANGWIGEGDDEEFAATKEKVEKILATI